MKLEDLKAIIMIDTPNISVCIPMTYIEWCSKAYDYKDFEIRYINYKDNRLEIRLKSKNNC